MNVRASIHRVVPRIVTLAGPLAVTLAVAVAATSPQLAVAQVAGASIADATLTLSQAV